MVRIIYLSFEFLEIGAIELHCVFLKSIKNERKVRIFFHISAKQFPEKALDGACIPHWYCVCVRLRVCVYMCVIQRPVQIGCREICVENVFGEVQCCGNTLL